MDLRLVERVNQRHETLRRIGVRPAQKRDVVDEQRPHVLGDRQKIRRSERRVAKLVEGGAAVADAVARDDHLARADPQPQGRSAGRADQRLPGLVHRRVRLRPQRRVIDLEAPHPRLTEIGRPVELMHVEPLHDQVDERQEQLALKPVLIQIARVAVRGRHQHHAAREQLFEQSANDHRVGDVGDLQLVETEQRRRPRHLVGDDVDRILGLLRPRRIDAAMHLLHEGVEMHPAFRLDRRLGEEQIHQHGFAATDAAEDVKARPLFDLGLAPIAEAEQTPNRAPVLGLIVPQPAMQQLEFFRSPRVERCRP